jgi:hypothetical protein
MLSGLNLCIVHSLNQHVLKPSGEGKGKGKGKYKSRGKGKLRGSVGKMPRVITSILD